MIENIEGYQKALDTLSCCLGALSVRQRKDLRIEAGEMVLPGDVYIHQEDDGAITVTIVRTNKVN